MSLDRVLDSLKRDGEYESSGSFSLDSKTSLEKLQKFQLLKPAQLVLHLVACASHRGATTIQFEIGPRDLRMAFDGKPFTASEMDTIFSSYFSADYSPLNRSRTELAIALRTIQQLDPDFVLLESWKGNSGQVLQLYEGQVWLESLERKGDPSQSEVTLQYLCYEERERLATYCFPTLTLSRRQEVALLRQRCGYGPAEVWLNGKPVLPPVWSGPGWVFTGEGPPPFRATRANHYRPAGFWGSMEAHVPHNLWDERPTEIHWVVGGVSFCETGPADFPRDLRLVLHAPELQKDVSHEGLVQNDVWRSRSAQLVESVRGCILEEPSLDRADWRTWARPATVNAKPILRRGRRR